MDLGLRQSDVARTIGVWTSTVNYWENGHFNPEPQYVPKIVAFLGYDPFGPPPDGFSAQLKAARIAAGLTRRQLAARVGVHPGYRCRVGAGARQTNRGTRRTDQGAARGVGIGPKGGRVREGVSARRCRTFSRE